MRTLLAHPVDPRVPRAALACPVCFGQNDSPLAKAMNMGILLMLVVVVAVLGGFASFIVYSRRRAAPGAKPRPRRAARPSQPQEGTAQC